MNRCQSTYQDVRCEKQQGHDGLHGGRVRDLVSGLFAFEEWDDVAADRREFVTEKRPDKVNDLWWVPGKGLVRILSIKPELTGIVEWSRQGVRPSSEAQGTGDNVRWEGGTHPLYEGGVLLS